MRDQGTAPAPRRFNRSKLRLFAGGLAVLLLVAGASFYATRATQKEVLLRYGLPDIPSPLQPLFIDETNSLEMLGLLYPPLMRPDPASGKLLPVLASSYDVAADGLTLSFTLQEGLRWSDGTTFTGEDYRTTFEVALRSERTVRKNALLLVAGAREFSAKEATTVTGLELISGGMRVVLHLTTAQCTAPSALAGAGGGILPGKYFAKYRETGIDIAKENNAPPAAMGPFAFSKKDAGGITLIANPHYAGIRPAFNTVRVQKYADPEAAASAIKDGELDVALAVRNSGTLPTPPDNDVRMLTAPGTRYYSVAWNLESKKAPILKQVTVRQGLSYAIDTSELRDIVKGRAQPVTTFIPPYSWLFGRPKLTDYSYSRTKAEALFTESGFKLEKEKLVSKGQPVTLRLLFNEGSPLDVEVAKILQKQYASAGITLELVGLPRYQIATAAAPGGDWDGLLLVREVPADPDPYTTWYSGALLPLRNVSSYKDERLDKALLAAHQGPGCNTPARVGMLTTAMQLVNTAAVHTFLFTLDNVVLANPRVQGIRPASFSSIWNLEQWRR